MPDWTRAAFRHADQVRDAGRSQAVKKPIAKVPRWPDRAAPLAALTRAGEPQAAVAGSARRRYGCAAGRMVRLLVVTRRLSVWCLASLSVLSSLLALAGCIKPVPTSSPSSPAPAVRAGPVQPEYRDLIGRFNRNVEPIKHLWSFATISLTWLQDGRTRNEQADGQLAVVLPDRLSLTAGKVHDFLRLGCDGQRYWWFDLRGPDTAVYFGRVSGVGAKVSASSPLRVPPHDLVGLLGIGPINPDAGGSVQAYQDKWLVEPHGARTRLLLDRRTARPVRIDLIDNHGYSRLTAELSGYQRIEMTGLSRGRLPLLATRIVISDLATGARARLSLSQSTGDRDAIRPQWFDLDLLIKALKPDEVHDLDAEDARAGREYGG